VTVRLNCALDLSFISFGAMHVTGYAVAPLDQYVGRIYGIGAPHDAGGTDPSWRQA
jgi:hypothetical protein